MGEDGPNGPWMAPGRRFVTVDSGPDVDGGARFALERGHPARRDTPGGDPMRLHDEHPHRPVTLVWLDADEAILLTGDGPADSGVHPPVIRRMVSGVPPHRRATGQAHHDSRVRSGGGADPDDLADRRREHLLAAYLREVAALVPEADRVMVIGPGQVHGRLAHELRAADARHRRLRSVDEAAAGPLTERQLRARWRELNGSAPERQLPANAGTRP